MNVVEEVIRDYHESLARDAKWARSLYEDLIGREKEHKLIYGGELLATLLRPYFVSADMMAHVSRICETIARCAEKIVTRYLMDEDLRHAIGLPEQEEELALIEPMITHPLTISRQDMFLRGSDLKLIEVNADSPASMAWTDHFEMLFDELPVMQALKEKYELIGVNRRADLLEAIREAYEDFGLGEELRIAIVDWRDVNTTLEFDLLKEYFEDNGVPTKIADPRDLAYRSDGLHAGDFRISCIYRRVITSELVDRIDECADMVKAARDHAVCLVNPFCSKVVGTKMFGVILLGDRLAHLFSEEEKTVLRDHIPWSRRCIPGKATFRGEEEDLFEIARAHQRDLVIKPVSDYGGRGIHIGRDEDEATWNLALEQARGGEHVIQEYVEIPEEEFPVFEPELAFAPRKVNLNPFVFGGRASGSMTRLSTSSIINVSMGGGIVPTYAVKWK